MWSDDDTLYAALARALLIQALTSAFYTRLVFPAVTADRVFGNAQSCSRSCSRLASCCASRQTRKPQQSTQSTLGHVTVSAVSFEVLKRSARLPFGARGHVQSALFISFSSVYLCFPRKSHSDQNLVYKTHKHTHYTHQHAANTDCSVCSMTTATPRSAHVSVRLPVEDNLTPKQLLENEIIDLMMQFFILSLGPPTCARQHFVNPVRCRS